MDGWDICRQSDDDDDDGDKSILFFFWYFSYGKLSIVDIQLPWLVSDQGFSFSPSIHPSMLPSLSPYFITHFSPPKTTKNQQTSQTTSHTPKNAIMVEPPLNEEECKIKKNTSPKKGGGARFNLARYRAMEMDKKKKKGTPRPSLKDG